MWRSEPAAPKRELLAPTLVVHGSGTGPRPLPGWGALADVSHLADQPIRHRARLAALPSVLIVLAVIETATVNPTPVAGQVLAGVAGVALLVSTRPCRSPRTGQRLNLLLDAPWVLAALAARFIALTVAAAVTVLPIMLVNHL